MAYTALANTAQINPLSRQITGTYKDRDMYYIPEWWNPIGHYNKTPGVNQETYSWDNLEGLYNDVFGSYSGTMDYAENPYNSYKQQTQDAYDKKYKTETWDGDPLFGGTVSYGYKTDAPKFDDYLQNSITDLLKEKGLSLKKSNTADFEPIEIPSYMTKPISTGGMFDDLFKVGKVFLSPIEGTEELAHLIGNDTIDKYADTFGKVGSQWREDVLTGGISQVSDSIDKYKDLKENGASGTEAIAGAVDRMIDTGAGIDTITRKLGEDTPPEIRQQAPAIGAAIGNAIYPVWGGAAGYGIGSKLRGDGYNSGFAGAGTSALASGVSNYISGGSGSWAGRLAGNLVSSGIKGGGAAIYANNFPEDAAWNYRGDNFGKGGSGAPNNPVIEGLGDLYGYYNLLSLLGQGGGLLDLHEGEGNQSPLEQSDAATITKVPGIRSVLDTPMSNGETDEQKAIKKLFNNYSNYGLYGKGYDLENKLYSQDVDPYVYKYLA